MSFSSNFSASPFARKRNSQGLENVKRFLNTSNSNDQLAKGELDPSTSMTSRSAQAPYASQGGKAGSKISSVLPADYNQSEGAARNVDPTQKKMAKKYYTSYSKLSEVKLITIGIASPLRILQWAEKTLPNGKVYGEVLNANTLHHKTFKPQIGGLFCERIFGPLKDFECACENTKMNRMVKQDITKNLQNGANRIDEVDSLGPDIGSSKVSSGDGPSSLKNRKQLRKYCPKCNVEYTWSVIRRYQLGYIKLSSPVTHIWFLKGTPSYLSLLLDMKKRHLQLITYCSETLTIENALGNTQKSLFLDSPSQIFASWESLWEQKTDNQPLPKPKTNVLKRFQVKPLPNKDWKDTNPKQLNSDSQTSQFLLEANQKHLWQKMYSLLSKNQFQGSGLSKKETRTLLEKFDLEKNRRSRFSIEFLFLLNTLNLSLAYDTLHQKRLGFDSLSDSHESLWQKKPLSSTTPLSPYRPSGHTAAPVERSPSQSNLQKAIESQFQLELNSESNLRKALLMSKINALFHKMPIDFYILCHLERTLHKKMILHSVLQTWEKMYSTAYIKALSEVTKVYLRFLKTEGLTLKNSENLYQTNETKSQISNRTHLNQRNQLMISNQISNFQRTLKTVKKTFQKSVLQSLQQTKQPLFLFHYTTNLNYSNFESLSLSSRVWEEKAETHKTRNMLRGESDLLVNVLCESLKKTLLLQKLLGTNRDLTSSNLFRSTSNLRFESAADGAFDALLKKGETFSNLKRIDEVEENRRSRFSNSLISSYPDSFQNTVETEGTQNSKDSSDLTKANLFSHYVTKQIIWNNKQIIQLKKELLISSSSGLENAYSPYRPKGHKGGKHFINRSDSKPRSDVDLKRFDEVKSLSHPDGAALKENMFSKEFYKRRLLNKKDFDKLQKKSISPYAVQGGKGLKADTITVEENRKKHTLYNTIYTLSHRERWESEKDWQIFMLYNSATPKTFLSNYGQSGKAEDNPSTESFRQPFSFSKESQASLFQPPVRNLKRIDEVEENRRSRFSNSLMNDTPILAYQSRVRSVLNGTLNNFDEIDYLSMGDVYSTGTLSNAFYSGPGIIQQLLNELTFSELKKLDKQNRLVLYQLNQNILKLKKQVKIFVYDKSAYMELKELCKKRDLLIRRTKLVRKLFRKDSDPSSMILTVLPVLPPDLRPIVKMGSQIAASDLNRLYQQVIYRNERLKFFLKDPATSQSYEMKYAQRLLQEAVDNLIQNSKSSSTSEKDSRGRALKSLSDVLKGKQGRFRQFLLGKRVDYSGRSVIVVGPKLKLHECGLPLEMALELYLPFLLKRILNKNYAKTVIGAKALIKNNPALAHELLREIMLVSPVLLNRAPTLHRLGIQAFVPKLVEGRAILLHPLVCSAFNADFDGDQMAVHIPITVEARAEAWKLMLSRNNILAPSTGDPLAIPSQDMVLGCYYLTTYSKQVQQKALVKTYQNSSLKRITDDSLEALKRIDEVDSLLTSSVHNIYFKNLEDVMYAYNQQKLKLHTLVFVKWNQFIENGNDLEEPIELRINSSGQWQEISSNYHRFYRESTSSSLFNQQNILMNQYMVTTPGRILFNLIIQNIQVEN